MFVNHIPDLTRFFERASLIVGDAAHCLRSALDHLVYQLGLREQGPSFDERKTMFFIAETADEIAVGNKRWLTQLSSSDRQILRPYQGDQRIHDDLALYPDLNPMIILRDLDDADKHRRLNALLVPTMPWRPTTPVASAIAWEGGLEPPVFSTEKAMFEIGTVELNAVLARLKTTDSPLGRAGLANPTVTGLTGMAPLETEEEFAGYVLPEIALTEGWPVVGALDKIAALVVNVIGEFEPFP